MPRTRKLTTERVDFSNPVTRGLVLAMPFSEGAGRSLRNAALRAPRSSSSFQGSPSWVKSAKRGAALRFNATTDYVEVGDDDTFLPTGPTTIILGWRKTDATLRYSLAFADNNGTGTTLCEAYLPYTDGVVYFDFGGTDGSHRISVGGLTFGDDIWAFTVGPRGTEIWQNGILRASNANNPTRVNWGGGTKFLLNKSAAVGGDLADCSLLHVWGRQLSASEIKTQHADPLGIYAPVRRHRSARPSASGITGTGAATAPAATASGAGRIVHATTGTPNATTPAVTSSGAGRTSHAGTGAASAPAATSSGAGLLVHPGSGSATGGAATTSGAGTLVRHGSGSAAAGAATSAGDGRLVHTATGASTGGSATSSGAGLTVGVQTGTGAATGPVATCSGVGLVVHRGAGGSTGGAATCSGAGTAGAAGGSGGGGHGRRWRRAPSPPSLSSDRESKWYDRYKTPPLELQTPRPDPRRRAMAMVAAIALLSASEDDYGL